MPQTAKRPDPRSINDKSAIAFLPALSTERDFKTRRIKFRPCKKILRFVEIPIQNSCGGKTEG